MDTYTANDGIECIEKNDDRVYAIVIKGFGASAARVGDRVDFGGVLYRVTGVGKPYKHQDYRTKVCRLYLAGAEEVPMTGGATEHQVTALRNWGVSRLVANAATKEQASAWIDELLTAQSMPGNVVDSTVRRINTLRE